MVSFPQIKWSLPLRNISRSRENAPKMIFIISNRYIFNNGFCEVFIQGFPKQEKNEKRQNISVSNFSPH
ncbi:MAG: hypothetical protein DI579_05370 [Lawsonella clevelandensis]|uniref:Uncharacterized protein n=1 Tax=Lawsonella clevelandensis TaxID=1528099 RepID=A0A2W5IAQ0_9ACTN|nr:MAG: hypothetical protein DI579_05370 [Lawsonella clevelandensis]